MEPTGIAQAAMALDGRKGAEKEDIYINYNKVGDWEETYDFPPSGPLRHSGVCVVPQDRQYKLLAAMALCLRLLLDEVSIGGEGEEVSLGSSFGVLHFLLIFYFDLKMKSKYLSSVGVVGVVGGVGVVGVVGGDNE